MGYAFHEFDSDYRIAKRLNLITRDTSPEDYLVRQSKSVDEWKGRAFHKEVLQARAFGQTQWYKCGQPYLKVYPGMAAHLAKISIDIPIEELVLPLPAFEIRLATTDNVFQETDTSPPLRNIFMFNDPEGDIRFGLDFGYRADELPLTIWFEQILTVEGGKTIQQLIDGMTELDLPEQLMEMMRGEAPRYRPSRKFTNAVMALCVSSCFFMAGSQEHITPDIPSRFVDRYIRAKAKGKGGNKEMEEILKQARKSGHTGYAVGREIDLPREVVRYHNESRSEGRSWEFQWSHVRSACWRRQPVGPRTSPTYERRFLWPTMVRPDLPMKPTPQGYRITDAQLPLRKT